MTEQFMERRHVISCSKGKIPKKEQVETDKAVTKCSWGAVMGSQMTSSKMTERGCVGGSVG